MLDELNLDAIRAAALRISPYVLRTPLLLHRLSDRLELLLKPESLQSTGAFKLRGAFSMMSTLAPSIPGVVAHSSGNHAQAVARAARVLGFRAVIVLPADAPALKRQRTAEDGAEVISVSSDSEERAQMAARIASDRGLVHVHPFDHPLIAAGQGTAALELVEDAGSRAMDRFYCPISGGGLISGCATVLAALSPSTEIIGVEPEDGNDTALSMAAGRPVKIEPPRTIADGLRVRAPGTKTWPVIQKLVSRVTLVSDDQMMRAMVWALAHLRLVLEPSGAAGLAAALADGGTGRVGILLSGGNVDPALLCEITRLAASAR